MSTERIVVMGVAGSGKTTIGERIAARLGAVYLEGDSFHSSENVAKMSSGVPLTDEDRWPWLASLRSRLRSEQRVVLSSSALRRQYRDVLRGAGNVKFVFLDLAEGEAQRRVGSRPEHYMGPEMVASQFAALERPDSTETDVAIVAANESVDNVVNVALAKLEKLASAMSTAPVLADGGPDRCITATELEDHIVGIAAGEILARGAHRLLLVPPDHTRLHSRAGEITGILYEQLTNAGCDVSVMPALGTHAEMGPAEVHLLFGDRIPYDNIAHHRWKDGLVRLGEIGKSEVEVLSQGRYADSVPVEVDSVLVAGWDMVVSVGQVVPHEVIGMANFTKNLIIGLGGAPTVHRSHFLGAVSDMETIMGRATSPVRDLVDMAFDRFVADKADVLWILTVMEDTVEGVVHRGLYAGRGRSSDSGGAAYRAAADLAATCNIDHVATEFSRVACWLDPDEFHSTWLGNKAIYRTRMAIADEGELIVLAPGVRVFGEDEEIDRLIRRHGYRGTQSTLDAMASDRELAASLGAAAHLIHGSSEGRFRIVYCTDPATGGLSKAEIEKAGFEWRSLPEELEQLGVDSTTPTGARTDTAGKPFTHISNPALGLWAAPHRLV